MLITHFFEESWHERALVRVANNNVDAGELVSSCQPIKDALDTFYVSCSFFFFQTTGSLTSFQVGLTLFRVYWWKGTHVIF